MNDLDVVTKGIKDKGAIVALHVLLSQAWLSIIGRTSLPTRTLTYGHFAAMGELHGDLVPLIHMFPVLARERNMDRCRAILKLAVVLLEAVLATAAEPKVRTSLWGTETTVRVSLFAFDHEDVAEGFEDGFVKVSHLGVVVTDGESNVREGHFGDGLVLRRMEGLFDVFEGS